MARNVADFMSEIFNGVGGVSGVNAQLNNKLDKTANAVSASKLQTARSMKVSLASNSAANFDGSANVTVGVDGILPVAHGGTGVNNLSSLNVGFATTASVAATSNFATRADQDCDGNKISTTYLKSGGTVASANKLATSRSFQTNLASTVAAGFDGTANNTHGVTGTLGVANGGTGQTSLANVTVGAATKLATSRTFQTNLASTAAANFDGTANNTHGVTGTLGVANGGTGQTSLANVTVGAASKATLDGAGNNIASTYLKTTGTAASATKLATSRSFQTNLASTVAAGFDGTANNTHGVTGTLGVANGGTGQTSLANVTVGAANKATLDGAGNNIVNTYAKKSDVPDFSKTVTIGGGFDYYQSGEFVGGINLGKTESGTVIMAKCPTLPIKLGFDGSNYVTQYQFKSDGIYLNGTKITN